MLTTGNEHNNFSYPQYWPTYLAHLTLQVTNVDSMGFHATFGYVTVGACLLVNTF